MSCGITIAVPRIVQEVDRAMTQFSVAKVLAAITGYPMPDPGCDCTTCRYRWSLIRRFLPKDMRDG